jgi:hypothetical protein
VFKRLNKIIALVLMFGLTIGCSTKELLIPEKLSQQATKLQQKEFKQEILGLLEKQYSQSFKIVGFRYVYKTNYDLGGNCYYCKAVKYGTYFFKIETVDKPYLSTNVKVADNESSAIDTFKEFYLNGFYCGALSSYYKRNSNYADKGSLEKAKKYCDARGQDYYKKWQ